MMFNLCLYALNLNLILRRLAKLLSCSLQTYMFMTLEVIRPWNIRAFAKLKQFLKSLIII